MNPKPIYGENTFPPPPEALGFGTVAESVRPDLECWSVGNGMVRIQTNSRRHLRSLRKLRGFTRSDYSVTGPFLAVFQGKMGLADARAYVAERLAA